MAAPKKAKTVVQALNTKTLINLNMEMSATDVAQVAKDATVTILEGLLRDKINPAINNLEEERKRLIKQAGKHAGQLAENYVASESDREFLRLLNLRLRLIDSPAGFRELIYTVAEQSVDFDKAVIEFTELLAYTPDGRHRDHYSNSSNAGKFLSRIVTIPFDNVLTGIAGNIKNVKDGLASLEKQQKYVTTALSRSNDITKKVRSAMLQRALSGGEFTTEDLLNDIKSISEDLGVKQIEAGIDKIVTDVRRLLPTGQTADEN